MKTAGSVFETAAHFHQSRTGRKYYFTLRYRKGKFIFFVYGKMFYSRTPLIRNNRDDDTGYAENPDIWIFP